jgi:IS66 Orf2 like protein
MIVAPAGVKVHLALGHTDMRKGLDGLATLIQEHLKKDPFSGHLFVFRGKNATLLKILFWDGMERGCACSPSASTAETFSGRAWRRAVDRIGRDISLRSAVFETHTLRNESCPRHPKSLSSAGQPPSRRMWLSF